RLQGRYLRLVASHQRGERADGSLQRAIAAGGAGLGRDVHRDVGGGARGCVGGAHGTAPPGGLSPGRHGAGHQGARLPEAGPAAPPQVRVPMRGPSPASLKVWLKMSTSAPASTLVMHTIGPAGAS